MLALLACFDVCHYIIDFESQLQGTSSLCTALQSIEAECSALLKSPDRALTPPPASPAKIAHLKRSESAGTNYWLYCNSF